MAWVPPIFEAERKRREQEPWRYPPERDLSDTEGCLGCLFVLALVVAIVVLSLHVLEVI